MGRGEARAKAARSPHEYGACSLAASQEGYRTSVCRSCPTPLTTYVSRNTQKSKQANKKPRIHSTTESLELRTDLLLKSQKKCYQGVLGECWGEPTERSRCLRSPGCPACTALSRVPTDAMGTETSYPPVESQSRINWGLCFTLLCLGRVDRHQSATRTPSNFLSPRLPLDALCSTHAS